MQTVAIVGVGLIGASFGLALKKAGFPGRILGQSSAGAIRDALRIGAIDREAGPADVARADLIYLAQPIRRIIQTLGVYGPYILRDGLVTDAGSTKREICEEARRSVLQAQFLGGHPMAGKEKRGAAEADADLFAGRTYVLTPRDRAELETPPAREFAGWIERIGAVPLVLSPEEHDRVVAFTSHLPQLLSTALAAALDERLQAPEHVRAAGPGLLDMTRLAASPFDIWADILATNAGPVTDALGAFIAKLEELRAKLGADALSGEFEKAASLARRLRGE